MSNELMQVWGNLNVVQHHVSFENTDPIIDNQSQFHQNAFCLT